MSASNCAVLERQLRRRPPRRGDAAGRKTSPRRGEHLGALVDAPRPCSGSARRSSSATAPVPVATSRTQSPGPASTWETRNRRQRGSCRTRARSPSGRTSARAGRRAPSHARALIGGTLQLVVWLWATISCGSPRPSRRTASGGCAGGRARLRPARVSRRFGTDEAGEWLVVDDSAAPVVSGRMFATRPR